VKEDVGVDVSVGVSVAREAARVGGTSIPAKSSAVAPNPMKRPKPRYLMSLRILFFSLLLKGSTTEPTQIIEKNLLNLCALRVLCGEIFLFFVQEFFSTTRSWSVSQ
jgi:hypothetical protein